MSKLVSPLPPREHGPDFLPNACWWRHAAINRNEHDHVYVITKDDCGHASCGPECPDAKWVTWEWFDGLDTVIDAGFDRPTAASMAVVYIAPIDYIDLLAETRPAQSFYRITEPGDRRHPGMTVCRDLDRR